jgi:ABC-type phosphate/phosphonate transport system substrate-binding protein
MRTLLMGAVAYDAKVVTTWDGFKAFFAAKGLDFDYVLTTHYERLADMLLGGAVDVAWNSPLAWIECARAAPARARAIAMRDTDRDLRSVILVRDDDSFGSLRALAGRRIGVGASDSPQATLIPLELLASAGVSVVPVRHDVLVGKHGDHVGGERDAVRALLRREVDAACCIDGNLLAFSADGTIPPGGVRVLTQTEPYDHCNFTVVADHPALDRFTSLLGEMSYADPEVRGLMDLEGLKAWLPGRTSGYRPLERAIDRFGTIDAWLGSRPS